MSGITIEPDDQMIVLAIEVTQRFQFIAEKLQAHRPRTRRRINIDDPAPKRDLAFLRHLRFRFVPLFFQPLDQIQRGEVFDGETVFDELDQEHGS